MSKAQVNDQQGWSGRSATTIAAATLFLLFMGSAMAGVIPGRWEKVDRLPPGAAIVVETSTQGIMAAVFESSDEIGLTLRVQDHSLMIPKSEILKVSMAEASRKSGGKGALKGAVIGGASVALLGALAASSDDCRRDFGPCFDPGKVAAMGAALGGGGGALIGFAIAKSRKSAEVLYRAP